MKKIRYYHILALCCIGMLVVSCKPKQQIVYSVTPVEDKENSELFTDILSASPPYNTLSARLNIGFTTGTRSLSSRASLRIVRNNALQVSVQPLFGVEMFRLHVDTDTLVVLDRMNKRYVKESLDELRQEYPVGFDFYTLQALFTNAVFVSGKYHADAADYRRFRYTKTSDLNYYLTAEDKESGIEYSFTVNGDDRITFVHLMLPRKNYSLQWAYNDFTVTGSRVFPHRMNVNISVSSRKVGAELQFSGIVTDEEMQLTMNVPESYTRVPVSEIVKIFAAGL